jgi:chromosome segregation ATPase
MLQEAANISKENVDRAMTVAHKLSMELRAAEDRISRLEVEIERLESRAARAEHWLEVIKKEIEDKLIAPMEANRPELPAALDLAQFEFPIPLRAAFLGRASIQNNSSLPEGVAVN